VRVSGVSVRTSANKIEKEIKMHLAPRAIVAVAALILLGVVVAQGSLAIRYGHIHDHNHPDHLAALRTAEVLSDLSDGRITMNVIGAGQLGGSREVMTLIQTGTIQMGNTSTFGVIEPTIFLLELPYLFRDRDHLLATLDSPTAQMVLDSLAQHSVIGLGLREVGFRHITNNRRPVYLPDDVRGLLLRAFEHEILKDTLAAFGASVNVMPLSEVYLALQTGLVDGQENPFLNIANSSLFEVQRYVSTTGHIHNFEVVAANAAWWNGLSEVDQEMVREAVSQGSVYHRELIGELNEQYRQLLLDEGMELNEIQDPDAWRAVVQPVYDKWAPRLGEEVIQQIDQIGR
jgi:TRAP-type transport system periplasmic protein